MKNKLFLGLVLTLSIMMLVVNSYAAEPKMGGVLKVVVETDPSTLDTHASSTTLNAIIAYHIFEGLYTLDKNLKVIPMLAADLPEISDDKLVYTIKIRPGVKFQNGKELTAEDVVASLKRWGKMSGNGKNLFKYVASIEAKDPLTLELKLTESTAITLVSLARHSGGAYIYPKDLCEKYPDKPLEEFIGTGPFKFVEWKPQQYIKVVRFDEYKPVDFPANGFGGKKVAYVDEIQFIPVLDQSTRLNAVEGGEYDFSDFIAGDEYSRLKDNPSLQALPSALRASFVFFFNKRAGIMKDVKMRKAVLTALDMAPMLIVDKGDEKFWGINPGLVLKGSIWWSDIGKEMYNQGDIEKAKMLLQESGYKGEKIVWMVSAESDMTLVAKKQLEKAGFNIDLQTMEFATMSERRNNPELWDVFTTGMTWQADPSMLTILTPGYPGWWESPKFIDLLGKFNTELDFDKRYKVMEEIQELFYTEIPAIKVGDYGNFRILAKNVHGFQNLNEPFFWNVWKD
jgi:peptide/nickel transport system substrate-binding protein